MSEQSSPAAAARNPRNAPEVDAIDAPGSTATAGSTASALTAAAVVDGAGWERSSAAVPTQSRGPSYTAPSVESLQQRLQTAEEQMRSSQQVAQAAHRDSARLVRLLQLLARPAADTSVLLARALETLSEAFDADVVCLVRGGLQPVGPTPAPAVSAPPVVIAACGLPAGTSAVLPPLPLELARSGGGSSTSSPGSTWNSDGVGDELALVVAGVRMRSAARLVLDPAEPAAGAVLLLRSDPAAITTTEVKLLQSLVERLHDGLAATERRHVAELLARAGDRFTRHRQCSDLFSDAVDLLESLTNAEWVGVVAIQDEHAVLRAQAGTLGLDLSSAWPRQQEALLGWDDLAQGKSHVTGDLALLTDHPDAPPRSQVRTVLSVPVMADGSVQVVLHALARTPAAFSPVVREAVEQLSACLSAALVSSRLYAALERSEQELRYRATHDALTGLANRALFREELDRRLSQAAANQETVAGADEGDVDQSVQNAGEEAQEGPGQSAAGSIGVIFCDLDDFKAVNDRLGHDAGDQLLRQASQRLNAAVRGGDLLARLGGDEFVVLLDPVPGVQEVHRIAERLLAALKEPVELLGQRGLSEQVHIGASMGGAVSQLGGDAQQCAVELLCNADAAMYEAKRAGGRRVRVFDAAAAQRAQRTAELARDITRAVQRGQVHVAYQPVWDLVADHPVGVEALARWTHPAYGAVGPDVFIPQAERSAAIIGIGQHVLRTALADLRTWDAPHLTVSVNASPVELSDVEYADRVLVELASAGVAPERLLIEITEGLPLVGPAPAQLARLRRAGVRVLIDDFGVSHSDLARLKHLQVDGLKIDKSLVDGLAADEDANSMDVGIVSAVLTLARTAKLSVVAEGVENHAQRAALVALGCTQAQGWLMSKAVSAPQLRELVTVSARGGGEQD